MKIPLNDVRITVLYRFIVFLCVALIFRNFLFRTRRGCAAAVHIRAVNYERRAAVAYSRAATVYRIFLHSILVHLVNMFDIFVFHLICHHAINFVSVLPFQVLETLPPIGTLINGFHLH